MLAIKLIDNIEKTAIRRINRMQKQMAFITAAAMSESAKKAQAALEKQTPRYVNNPIRFTLNSTFVKFAKASKLEASVGFKEFASKGTPAGKYLEPMIQGGARRPKSTERQLQNAGLLRPGQFIVPTDVTPLKLNRYGNLAGGKYTQVLSRLKALGEQGYTGNVSKASNRAARDYFIGSPGGLRRGIQARVGRKPKGTGGRGSAKGGRPITSNLPRGFHTVFYITRRPTYKATFPAIKILIRTFQNNYSKQFKIAFEKEIAFQAARGR